MSDDAYLPRYIKLADFAAPDMPTQRAFELFFSKAMLLFKRDDAENEEAISSDRLHKTPDVDLDSIAPAHTCGPLTQVLDNNLIDWLNRTDSPHKIKTLVLPPCDENDILKSWAQTNRLKYLEPPTPHNILSQQAELPDIQSGDPLIIPRLEAWMLRTYRGLDLIRGLLQAVADSERKIVIGCNIYAWEFLKKAVDAAAYLPDPMTFAALNDSQLRHWFHQLHAESSMQGVTLRYQQSAKDVFDEAQADDDDYFEVLAATSLGIPWVAWHLWRENLLTQDDDVTNDDHADEQTLKQVAAADEQTLWVSALKELSLPNSENDLALFVLQAILIHNQLSADNLSKVLPEIRPLTAVPLLKRAGIISEKHGLLSCKPAAYPAIRRGLKASGFPLGAL